MLCYPEGYPFYLNWGAVFVGILWLVFFPWCGFLLPFTLIYTPECDFFLICSAQLIILYTTSVPAQEAWSKNPVYFVHCFYILFQYDSSSFALKSGWGMLAYALERSQATQFWWYTTPSKKSDFVQGECVSGYCNLNFNWIWTKFSDPLYLILAYLTFESNF